MNIWYKICHKIGRFIIYYPLISYFWPIKVIGKLPKTGPAIIVSNHHSFIEPPLLALIEPKRKLWFLAIPKVFKWKIIGWLLKKLDCVKPIATQSPFPLRTARKLLNQGQIIVIFPEGTRTNHNDLLKFNEGCAWLALNSKFQDSRPNIIPAAFKGTLEVLPRNKKMPKPGQIKIIIGEPLEIKENHNKCYIIEIAMKQISLLLGQG